MKNWIRQLSEAYVNEMIDTQNSNPDYIDPHGHDGWPVPMVSPSGIISPDHYRFPSPGNYWRPGMSRRVPTGVRGLSPITDPNWTYSPGPPPSWSITANGITYTLVYINGQYYLQATTQHSSIQWIWNNGQWEIA